MPPLKAAYEDETRHEALRTKAANQVTNLRTPGGWFNRACDTFELYDTIASGALPPVAIEPRLELKIETDFDRYNRRHDQEHAVADYIEQQVLPITTDPRFTKMVDAMRACHDTCTIYHCEKTGDRRYAWDAKCNQSKLCPHDARLVANELIETNVPAFEYLLGDADGRQLQFWVLAPPNVDAGELKEKKQAYYAMVQAELARQRKAGNVVGSFVTQEDPLGADGNFNVHFNVLTIVEGGFAPWSEIKERLGWQCRFQDQRGMIKKTLNNLRRRSQELAYLTPADVLRAAMVECVKYSAKLTGAGKSDPNKGPPMIEWPPEQWLAWYYANLGFRRIRTYGALNGQVKYCPTEKPRASWPVIGARIRRAREALNWSAVDLAYQLARVDPSELRPYSQLHLQLRGWETGRVETDDKTEGRVRAPTSHQEALLAGVLQTDVLKLFHMPGASVFDLVPEKEPDTRVWVQVGTATFDRISGAYRPLILIKAPKSGSQLSPVGAELPAGEYHCLDPPLEAYG